MELKSCAKMGILECKTGLGVAQEHDEREFERANQLSHCNGMICRDESLKSLAERSHTFPEFAWRCTRNASLSGAPSEAPCERSIQNSASASS